GEVPEMSLPSVARPGLANGPNGIIGTLTYSNGKYTVTMRTDGAIRVKQGDWLSKYSKAMYNDFKHVREFARMDASGRLRPIRNLNLIFAGETVYHMPTYRKFHPMRMEPVEVIASPLTEAEEERLLIETLKAEYHLAGERFHLL